MTSESERLNKWREGIKALIAEGERLQKVAETLPGEFIIRPQWPGIDWVEIGIDLETFAARVRLVSEVLGEPESCKGEHWIGQSETDSPPDLIARWEHEGCEITIRALIPTGCMVDPRTKFVKQATQEIHPQCKAVLDDLAGVP